MRNKCQLNYAANYISSQSGFKSCACPWRIKAMLFQCWATVGRCLTVAITECLDSQKHKVTVQYLVNGERMLQTLAQY